jgi:hypothetical protein
VEFSARNSRPLIHTYSHVFLSNMKGHKASTRQSCDNGQNMPRRQPPRAPGAEIVLARRKLFEREMAGFRARWEETGEPSAVAAAARIARQRGQAAPAWLIEAIEQTVLRATKEDELRARRAFVVHLPRHQAVARLNDRGVTLTRAFTDIAEHSAKSASGSVDKEMVEYSYYLIEAAGGYHATFKTYRLELKRRRQPG